MAIAKVGTSLYLASTGGSGFTSTPVDTVLLAPSAIVVAVVDSVGTVTTLTDASSNAYGAPAATSSLAGASQVKAWVLTNPILSTAQQWVVDNGLSAAPAFGVLFLTGTASASAVDQSTGATSTTSLTVQPGSITPGVANEILVTVVGSNQSLAASTEVDAPFVLDGKLPVSGSNWALGLGYEIQAPGPTARNPTWTLGGVGNNAAVVLSVKAATAAGTAQGNTLLLLGVGR